MWHSTGFLAQEPTVYLRVFLPLTRALSYTSQSPRPASVFFLLPSPHCASSHDNKVSFLSFTVLGEYLGSRGRGFTLLLGLAEIPQGVWPWLPPSRDVGVDTCSSRVGVFLRRVAGKCSGAHQAIIAHNCIHLWKRQRWTLVSICRLKIKHGLLQERYVAHVVRWRVVVTMVTVAPAFLQLRLTLNTSGHLFKFLI